MQNKSTNTQVIIRCKFGPFTKLIYWYIKNAFKMSWPTCDLLAPLTWLPVGLRLRHSWFSLQPVDQLSSIVVSQSVRQSVCITPPPTSPVFMYRLSAPQQTWEHSATGAGWTLETHKDYTHIYKVVHAQSV